MKTVKIAFSIMVMLAYLGLNNTMGQWATSGLNIYNTNTGYVGIGNNTPSVLLHVAKNMTEPSISVQNLGGSGGATYSMIDNVSGANWKFKATNTGGFKIRDHAFGMDVISIEPNSAANSFCIDAAGNVGIGTAVPASKFQVAGGDARINDVNVGIGAGSNGANTVLGSSALDDNTTGVNNTAVGWGSLSGNTDGQSNSAVGWAAMYNNQGGNFNTAVGASCLSACVSGTHNAALGSFALNFNTGSYNTALGADALKLNSAGQENIAIGFQALYNNRTAGRNIAIGNNALYNIAWNGSELITDNVAVGYNALWQVQSGFGEWAYGVGNTSVGNYSSYWLSFGNLNTAVGKNALGAIEYQDGNTAMGAYAGPNGPYNNTTALGYLATTTGSDMVRIGSTSTTSIGGYAGWTTLPSDRRFKSNVNENVPGLDFINELHPVTYNIDVEAIDQYLQKNIDQTGPDGKPSPEMIRLRSESRSMKENIVYSGFIAQDVEAAANRLGYDFSGVDAPKNENDIYGLRYAEFTVPLVKAVQELSAKNVAQQQVIEELLQRIEKLENK